MISLATKLKGLEYCDLNDKEYNIAVMNTLTELCENSERQFNQKGINFMNQRSSLPKILKL